MNILTKTSLKYLKKQKKHTVFTTVSITLVAMLLTVIAVAGGSALQIMKNICMEENGKWHVSIGMNIEKKYIDELEKNVIFESTGVLQEGTIDTEDTLWIFTRTEEMRKHLPKDGKFIPVSDEDLIYIYKNNSDLFLQNGLDALGSFLLSGRFPENANEIVLPQDSLKNYGYPTIGDKVIIPIKYYKVKELTENDVQRVDGKHILKDENGEREVGLEDFYTIEGSENLEYTLVGISEHTAMVNDDDTKLDKCVTYYSLYARCKKDVGFIERDVAAAANNIGYEITEDDVCLNQYLLMYEMIGTASKARAASGFAGIFIGVLAILLAIRFVIDCSFEISSKSRMRQFGILKSAGASGSQIIRIVLVEAFVMALAGIATGILLGIGSMNLFVSYLKSTDAFRETAAGFKFDLFAIVKAEISPLFIGMVAVLVLVWVMFSALGVTMRVVKMSPIEAINNGSKMKKIPKPKKYLLSKLLFGHTGVMAAQNIRRNKKRFFITVVSLALSISLFSGFSFYLYSAKKAIAQTESFQMQGFDLSVTALLNKNDEYSGDRDKLIETGFFSNVQIDDIVITIVDDESLNQFNEDYLNKSGFTTMENGTDGKKTMKIFLNSVNRETYKELMGDKPEVSYDEFKESGGILLEESIYAMDYPESGNVEKVTAVDKGKELGLKLLRGDESNKSSRTYKVMGTYSKATETYGEVSTSGLLMGVIADESFESMIMESRAISDAIREKKAEEQKNSEYIEEAGSESISNMKLGYNFSLTVNKGNIEKAREYLHANGYTISVDYYMDNCAAKLLIVILELCCYGLLGIISLIVAVNVINIISTGMLDRRKEIAMLRAVGMSDGQLKKMAVLESVFYALIAFIISLIIIAGVTKGTISLFTYMNDEAPMNLSYVQPAIYAFEAFVCAFFIVLVGAVKPLQDISNEPIVEVIREIE